MAEGKTVTVDCAPLCNEEHDLEKEKRDKLDYVDHERTQYNITYERHSLHDIYQEQFGDAIEQYNAKQTRNDRKKTIDGYIEELETNVDNYKKMSLNERKIDNSTKSRYEILLYVGDQYDTGYKTDPAAAKQAEEILDEFVKGFKERNPNMIVQYAYMHKDEVTPHAGIAVVPVAKGYKKGMNKRVSMSRALEQQGFPDKRGEMSGFDRWILSERAELKRLAEARGLTIIQKNDPKREKLTRSEYISQQRAMEREVKRQLEQELEKEPLHRLPEEKANMLGYVSEKAYKQLYKEYMKLGNRCWKAEKLIQETKAEDTKQMTKNIDYLLKVHDDDLGEIQRLKKALALSQGKEEKAVEAFKTAVGLLPAERTKDISSFLQKAGYDPNMTDIVDKQIKKLEQHERLKASRERFEKRKQELAAKSKGNTRTR